MYIQHLLYLLALATLGLTTETRKLHRQNGGYSRIINPDTQDSELMKFEASGSRNKKQNKPAPADKAKTLSQQVADGKYGLIQKELFSTPQKRPGILSYEDNPEVPKDNKDNLGGLDKNEIWLAENHLLVIRGGKYPPHDDKNDNAESIWPPIDNYKAPLHQVKIPAHPKVPPPFPVQLTEDGPLQILGTNSSRTLNETEQSAYYSISPSDGYEPGSFFPSSDSNSTNSTPWETPLSISLNTSGEYPEGVPFPPFLLNGTLPPYLGYLPPGASILPPPSDNQTDLYDYDDPSIYYPPPYSFYYPKDNSSLIPAGPLVPGIILPPPPNFFAPLEETTTGVTTKITNTPQRYRKPTTTQINAQIRPTTTSLPPTIGVKETLPEKLHHHPVHINEIKPTVVTTMRPKVITLIPVRRDRTYLPQNMNKQIFKQRPQDVTILRPIKPKTPPPKIYIYENEISNKPFRQYGPPTANKKPALTTTQVPVKYYTTSNKIETNSVTHISEKFVPLQRIKSSKPTLIPPQYYYYGDERRIPIETTLRPPINPNLYVDSTEEFNTQPKPIAQRKPQYIYVTGRPYNTQKPRFRFIQQTVKPDTYSIHIAKLQKQIHQYYTTPRPTYRPVSKPVYQYSFQAANYQSQQNNFKPSPPELSEHEQFRPVPKYSVQIQQAIEIIPSQTPKYQSTPSPIFYQQNYQRTTERQPNYYTTPRSNYQYETITEKAKYLPNVVTPKPITDYSFQVTPNPIYQGFYTKPDEGFFDDNTKKYFTMFGRKLPGATTPIPDVEQTTPEMQLAYTRQSLRGFQYEQESNYHQKPISLESDTLVNYANPRPPINPDAELIEVQNPNNSPRYPNVVKYPARPPQYNTPLRQGQKNTGNAEIIKAIPIEVPSRETKDGSFISYRLPGDDGAHFYFLTPQLAQSTDQGAGFYYSQPSSSRIRRNERKRDKER